MKVVTVEQMQTLEAASVQAGVSLDTLMENAGRAVAVAVRERLEARKGRQALVLVGAGNNGGDGLVAARCLAEWGASATAYLCAPRPSHDEKLELARAAGVAVTTAGDDPGYEALHSAAASAAVVVDAVLGTGRARPIEMPLQAMLATVRTALREAAPGGGRRAEIIALDLPSGMNADTGQTDPAGLPADLILVLGRPKVGLFVSPSATPWRTLDIGIPDGLDAGMPVDLLSDELVAGLMPARTARSNKGTFGRVLAVAGSESYVGAAFLACSAAGRSGAGLVTLATPDTVYPLVAGRLSECTYVPLVEISRGTLDAGFAAVQVTDAARLATAMLIGPGLGQAPQTVEFVRSVLLDRREGPRLVLDADCLNALRDVEEWPSRVRGPAVLTPHPGELARLMNVAVPDIEHDRLQAALTAAERWDHVVALKGACTVVAHPDGRARVSRWANPGLATGGTGDVLAGMVAALLAQGLSPFDAASVGVHAHGLAGEAARARLGEVAMVAGDLLEELPGAFQRLS